jgi:hypothetical protein
LNGIIADAIAQQHIDNRLLAKVAQTDTVFGRRSS